MNVNRLKHKTEHTRNDETHHHMEHHDIINSKEAAFRYPVFTFLYLQGSLLDDPYVDNIRDETIPLYRW